MINLNKSNKVSTIWQQMQIKVFSLLGVKG